MAMARWGMASPQFVPKGRTTDPGVTDVRNVKSARQTAEDGHVRVTMRVPANTVAQVKRRFAGAKG